MCYGSELVYFSGSDIGVRNSLSSAAEGYNPLPIGIL